MNIVSILLFVFLCIVGAIVLLPVLTIGAVAVLALGALVIWLLPILLIANSYETTGGEKLCWILAILCLSWFAWILYFLVAPIKPRQDRLYYY
jgi:hypothetical protein